LVPQKELETPSSLPLLQNKTTKTMHTDATKLKLDTKLFPRIKNKPVSKIPRELPRMSKDPCSVEKGMEVWKFQQSCGD
jgi:hypothetical protein